jgi:hypothetical protein
MYVAKEKCRKCLGISHILVHCFHFSIKTLEGIKNLIWKKVFSDATLNVGMM